MSYEPVAESNIDTASSTSPPALSGEQQTADPVYGHGVSASEEPLFNYEECLTKVGISDTLASCLADAQE
jgi:hypothetical protein